MDDNKSEARGRLYLTPKQFAEQVGVNIKTVYAAMKKGSVPFVRVGRTVRIPSAALETKNRNPDGSGKWEERKWRQEDAKEQREG